MKLPEISIRRPVFAWMLMFGLIIFGAIGFMRMGVSQLPDVDFPTISISTSYEGAAPAVMETEVVDPIEDAMMSIQGVTSVSSSSRNSSASINIEFDLDRNIDLALQDVQGKLLQVQRRLPREMDPPTVSKTNPEDQPILWLALESTTMSTRELMLFVRDQIKDQFSTLSGVGEVFLGGFVDPNLRIWADEKSLEKYQLTVGDIISTIQNEHVEAPAGRLEAGSKEFNVRTLGEVETVEDFKKIFINTRGGSPNFTPISLGQVATIEEGLADIRRISRANGKPSVGLGIRKQRGANAVAVADAVKEKMTIVQQSLPEGTKLGLRFDTTQFIKESVGELNFTLVLSALLTAFVCWMFVGSWSSTLNILLAIPTSIVGTFIILYFSGFTLNTFTLLGLSLAIGIVVDDAIMVLENVIRHREMGKSREQAALDGSIEITFAAVAATISVCAIFLPVAFMTGVIGKYFYQFGVTMTAAVLLSLLEALTLTPMRCAQFVEAVKGERATVFGRSVEHAFERTKSFYTRTLGWALGHPWKIVMGSLALFAVSLVFVRFINKELLPAEDQGRIMVRLQTPVGSSLDFTDKKSREVEQYLATQKDIEGTFLSIGGFGGGGEVNTAVAFLTLTPRNDRELSQHQIMDRTRKDLKQIKDVRATIQDQSMRGFTSSRGFPVEFSVRGPDWNKLAEYSEKIMAEMEKTGMMADIDSNYEVGMPEIQIIPDREKASARGVSISAIGQTINATIGGVLVGRYPSGGHRYDIRLKLKDTEMDRRERIKHLFVRNNRGEIIPLSQLVRVEERPTLQVISRKDRQRAISVFANVATGVSQDSALQKSQEIARGILPAGYRAVMSGSSQAFKESQDNLIFALLLGIVVAYMVLASQFNSFRDPVAVLLALPFSITGALLALLVTRQSLNLYSMIGIILLMGIVKKNSILLVEFTNQLRERGEKNIVKALLEACPIRLRPILMTSIATIAGAVPLALGIGPGAESRIPMAIAVIGGVLVSTILTLYVVPCFYLKISSKHIAHS